MVSRLARPAQWPEHFSYASTSPHRLAARVDGGSRNFGTSPLAGTPVAVYRVRRSPSADATPRAVAAPADPLVVRSRRQRLAVDLIVAVVPIAGKAEGFVD